MARWARHVREDCPLPGTASRWLAAVLFLLASLQPAQAFDWQKVMDSAVDGFGKSIERNVDRILNEPQEAPEKAPAQAPLPSRSATAPAPSEAGPASAPAPEYDRNQVIRVQRLLTALGYDPGPVDGAFGQRTGDAIRAYEADHGLPASGLPSVALADHLEASLRGGSRGGRATAAAPARPADPPVPASVPASMPPGNTPVSPAAEAFLAAVPAPEGVSVGMPLAKAVATLEGRGYAVKPVAGCMLERRGEGSARDEIHLAARSLAPPDPRASYRIDMMLRCNAGDDAVVTGIRFSQHTERASRPDRPEAEIAGIVARLGPHEECTRGAAECVWRAPGGDVRIRSLSVTMAPGWGRRLDIEADILELRPDIPEREPQREVMTRQALAVCENADVTDFTVLKDCACIARKVGKAYVRGEISRVDVHMVNRYTDGCPGAIEGLRPHFADLCLDMFAARASVEPSVKAWALGGGCTCAGDKAADAYTEKPDHYGLKTRLGMTRTAAEACGMAEAKAGRTPVIPQTVSAGGATGSVVAGTSGAAETTASRVNAEGAGYTVLGETPAGFRPLEIWLDDGRPVLHTDDFHPLTALDRTFKYDPQKLALARYVNLLMLADQPELIEEPGALEVLAAENLSLAEAERLLKGCRPGRQSPHHCSWKGADEFEVRAAQQEFRSRHATGLAALARTMPHGLVVVESARLGDYDSARGGFPLDVSSWNRQLQTIIVATPESLFGYGSTIRAEVQSGLPEPFWAVDEAAAQPILERLAARGSPRFVKIAISHAIVDIRLPTDKASEKRRLILKPEWARIYGDARLTDELGTLPLAGEAAPAPAPSETASASTGGDRPAAALAAADREPLLARPLELETLEGRLVIDPHGSDSRTRDALMRWSNLVLLNAEPELLQDPKNVLFYAHQNLVGLTNGKSPPGWAGADEFAWARTKARFAEGGPAKIMQLAREQALPQDVLIRRDVYLAPYDFDRETFAIIFDTDAEGDLVGKPVDNGADLFLRRTFGMVTGGLLVQWTGGALSPKAWSLPPDEAQRAVAEMEPKSGGRRFATYVSVARLLRVGKNHRGHTTFEAELVETRLYADRELTQLVATLPAAERTAESR